MFDVGRVLALTPPPAMKVRLVSSSSSSTVRQGLTLVHSSAQRKDFLGELLLSFSHKNGSG